MKRTSISAFICSALFISQNSFAQAPPIEWQNTIGGSSYDDLISAEHTSDGGYILGGPSASGISGDKSEAAWPGGPNGFDYWIVKLNATGTIEWQNTIGGTNDDYLNVIRQTPDGGYICGGYSASGISGDKTEISQGGKDYWILKLDAAGAIIWQNTIGGSLDDIAVDIELTTDGGYLVGGYSYSGISGDKTENNNGVATSGDYWLVRLNATGNIVWQNTIGGSSQEYLHTIKALPDGGFIIGGTTYSGISGDKTEASMGGGDYWIMKIDDTGNIIWQNGIGGSNVDNFRSLALTSDGGYIVAGESRSLYSGDKTETTYLNTTFYSDYWILKLDAAGNIVWQNDIGGDRDDLAADIIQTMDGGYVVVGNSLSAAVGDKTEGVIGGGTIYQDFWVIKLNATGGIIWQNTIGGTNFDGPNAVDQTADGGIFIAGGSYSGIGGDKTEPNMGPSYGDFWVIKLVSTCIPSTEICNLLDDDCDGAIDEGLTASISIAADGPTTYCQGGHVNLIATATAGSLQWKKAGVEILGATSATYTVNFAGTYTCTVTSPCGTVISNAITVVVNKNPNAVVNHMGATEFCAGGSVLLTETPIGGCSYQWYKGATPIAGQTTTNYTATTTGNYKCRVTKTATGCFKNSNSIAVSVTCKEGQEMMMNSVDIYPDPAQDYIQVKTDVSDPFVIQIMDIAGRIIKSQYSDEELCIMQVNDLPSGVYFIQINNDLLHIVKEFVKE